MTKFARLKLSWRSFLFIPFVLVILSFALPGSGFGMVNPPLPNHFAIVAPEVYITDLSLPKLSFNLGEEIKVGDEATAMLEIQSDGSRLARTVTVFVE